MPTTAVVGRAANVESPFCRRLNCLEQRFTLDRARPIRHPSVVLHLYPRRALSHTDYFRLGAEVIKVESNNALSVIGGQTSATVRRLGQSHNWNTGKLSISLNMKTFQGIDIAKSLATASNVVAEQSRRTAA